MSGYTEAVKNCLHQLAHVAPFLPFGNPTFGNPDFEAATYRVLIVRLSPFRDVDRSTPHLFLFQEVRRAVPDAYVDMAFFPVAKDRELFTQQGIPYIVGVQSLRSADEFDLVLISNAYTLELINLPYLLDHSNIPLLSSQRGPEWPLVILGGSNAMASQAIIRENGDSFVDGVFFGEGEGRVRELVSVLRSASEWTKRDRLQQAAHQVAGFWATGSFCPTPKAVLRTPDADLIPVDYPILNTSNASTANLQINYGCPAFCSFCFEGYDRKPYRELPKLDALAAARQIKQAQGSEQLNLYGFNFNAHQDILDIIPALHKLFDRVSFKSQRLDILQATERLLEAEVEAGKSDFTLGIEGISERQRAFLHKSLTTQAITALLRRLLSLKIRRVKLLYILTGHETDEDLAEFRGFVRWVKTTRRTGNRGIRVVFSFGLLIRMPFTPLRYDRLLLEERGWRSLIGRAKSACETNGFEFRLAFDWPAYCVSQVLAMGGYWLSDAIVDLSRKGYCFEHSLVQEYWDKLRQWMMKHGYWDDTLLGEKGPDYAFALEFVEQSIPASFLYGQYQEAQNALARAEQGHRASTLDSGYCLGSRRGAGACKGCGACTDKDQRTAITRHRSHRQVREGNAAQLRELVARKRRLERAYYLLRLSPKLANVVPEFLNSLVFRELLRLSPELVDNLLSVRESLFALRPNDQLFPFASGETIFGVKAWDVGALKRTLADRQRSMQTMFQIVGAAEGFTPGKFTQLHLAVHLPRELFPDPRGRLERYLRGAYVRFSVRREGALYRFDLPGKALKKRILFGGSFTTRQDGFYADLDVGPKFSLIELLGSFGHQNLHRHARVQISELAW